MMAIIIAMTTILVEMMKIDDSDHGNDDDDGDY